MPAYEPMRYPDEEEKAGWNILFDGASNQKVGIGEVPVSPLVLTSPLQ